MDRVKQLVQERSRMTDARPAIDWGYTEAREIHPGVFMSEGITNAYMVATAGSRVIINTGMGFECKLVHKPLFDAACELPASHIITTQAHVDLVGGVGQFRDADTVYIAQANNAACQHDDALISKGRSSLYKLTLPPIQGIFVSIAKSVNPFKDSKNVQKISGSFGFPN